MLFSETTQAFYDKNANYGSNMPADAEEITGDEYAQFYAAVNSARRVYKSASAFVISIPQPDKYYTWDENTSSWKITAAMSQQRDNDAASALKQTASSEVTRSSTLISILSDKVELQDFSGAETSDSVTATLTIWKKYRIDCNSVVTGSATELPMAPDA
ncbi:hypothetical protein BS639_17255 [Rouxiella silvae]|uniref:Phage tail protein n=1 Tax=Rouxiella silvae TaxID=1646373 RepID=A0ABX3TXT1_9GAMM|nr:tail fiber assembly protein [Rouxiella silvae]ORJ20041.1 hypothetical protein BS639_17255 [Rouxiella silvae]